MTTIDDKSNQKVNDDNIDAKSHDSDSLLVESTSLYNRICIIFHMALPLIFSYCLRIGEILILLYYAGYVTKNENNTKYFSGISLSLMFINISVLSIFAGII